jgi:hypothetical protein
MDEQASVSVNIHLILKVKKAAQENTGRIREYGLASGMDPLLPACKKEAYWLSLLHSHRLPTSPLDFGSHFPLIALGYLMSPSPEHLCFLRVKLSPS